MHHSKPVLHEGRGDTRSEADGSLAETLTLRLPDWQRGQLDEFAAQNDPPFSMEADDAGSVARELIAAGLLKNTLIGYYGSPQITSGGDLTNSDGNTLGELHGNLDSQLTIRMPAWLRSHINDVSDVFEGSAAEGAGATTRDLIELGRRLYASESFPYGQPVPPSDDVRCPECVSEATEAVWERSYEFYGPRGLVDLFDDLDLERDNPYNIYINSNYTLHGWWLDSDELAQRSHPLYEARQDAGDWLDSHHPDVETPVTVAHCHMCNWTAPKHEFRRAWYRDRGN